MAVIPVKGVQFWGYFVYSDQCLLGAVMWGPAVTVAVFITVVTSAEVCRTVGIPLCLWSYAC